MEFNTVAGLQAVCGDLEGVAQQLHQEFKSSADPHVQQLPDLIRRIETLQAVSERINRKAEILCAHRQSAVLQVVAGLLANARKLKAADTASDGGDIDAAASALTDSVRACSFLQGGERDMIVSGGAGAVSRASPPPQRPQQQGRSQPHTQPAIQRQQQLQPEEEENDALDPMEALSQEDRLFASFEALPRHVKGHIKFADVMGILGKISTAVDELVEDKSLDSRATRRSKAVVSRFTVKLPLKDVGRCCGQKASGKSGQAILLILRSLGVVKMDREHLTLVDQTIPLRSLKDAAARQQQSNGSRPAVVLRA